MKNHLFLLMIFLSLGVVYGESTASLMIKSDFSSWLERGGGEFYNESASSKFSESLRFYGNASFFNERNIFTYSFYTAFLWDYEVVESHDKGVNLFLRELFYSRLLGDHWEITLGKRIFNFSKSYSVTPLNVFETYPYQVKDIENFDQLDEGVYAFSVNFVYSNLAITAIASSDLEERDYNNEAGSLYVNAPPWQYLTIFDAYIGNMDLTGLGGYRREDGFFGGVGGAIVVNDALELHGEALFLSSARPLAFHLDDFLFHKQDGEKAVFLVGGFQYTLFKFNFVLEGLYNSLLYNKEEWEEYRDYATTLRESPGLPSEQLNSGLSSLSSIYANELLTNQSYFLRIDFSATQNLSINMNIFMEPYFYSGFALMDIDYRFSSLPLTLRMEGLVNWGNQDSPYGNSIYPGALSLKMEYAL